MRSEELIIIVGTASGWRLLLALCVRSSQSSAAQGERSDLSLSAGKVTIDPESPFDFERTYIPFNHLDNINTSAT